MALERDTTDTALSPARRGSLKAESIFGVLLELSREKKTGALVVETRGRRREIALRQGQIWAVRVDQMEEAIPARLQLPEATMASVLLEVIERGVPFRLALTRILADSDLGNKLKQIHHGRLVDVLCLEEGEFHWFEGERFVEGAQDPVDLYAAIVDAVEQQGTRHAQDLLRAKRHRLIKKTEAYDNLKRLAPYAFKEGSVAPLFSDKSRSYFDLVTSGFEPDRAARQLRSLLLLGAIEFDKVADPKGKEELPPYVTRLATRAKEEQDQAAKISLGRRVEEAKRLLGELGQKPREAKLLGALRVILRDAEIWDGYFEVAEREREALEQNRDYKAQLALYRELANIWDKKLLRVDEAANCYTGALSFDPEDQATRAKLKELLLDAGDLERALTLDEEQLRGVTQENKRVQILLSQAKLLWDRGQGLDAAKAKLVAAQALRPEDPELVDFLLKIETRDPDPEIKQKAVKRLLRLSELAATPPKRDVEKAILLVERARALEPTSAEVLDVAEKLYRAKADHEGTAEILSEALVYAQDPKARAELRKKLSQLPLGPVRTREYLEALLFDKASPDDIRADALTSLRTLLGRSGEQARFAFFLEEEITRAQGTPKAIQYALELAQLYARSLEDPTKAVSVLEGVLLAEPEQQEVVNALRSLGRVAGWASIARLLARSAFEGRWRDPRDPNRIKRLEEAARMMEERVLDPARASTLWRRLDELDPGATQSREAVRRIEAKMALQQEVLNAKEREVEAAFDPLSKAAALKKLAVVYYEQAHDAVRAISAYARAWEIIPGDQEVISKLEALYIEVQDWEGVAKLLYHRLANATDVKERYEILWRYAQVCEERIGRPDAAASALSEILVEHPDDAFAIARLEWLYYRSGDFNSYLGARARHAALSADLNERGAIYAQMAEICEKSIGDRERAVDLWRWSLESRPTDWRARLSLARLLAPLGRFEELADLYEAWANEKKPGSPRRLSYLRLAAHLAKDRIKNTEREVRCLQQITKEDPEDGEALVRLAELAAMQGDAATWLETGQRILACRMGRPTWSHRLKEIGLAVSKAYEAENHPQEALAILRQLAHGAAAGDRATLDALARCELKAGDPYNAIWAKERALRKVHEGSRPAAAAEVAELWERIPGGTAGKILALKRLCEFAPQDPRLLEALSEAYASQGEWARVLELSNKRLALTEQPETRVNILHYIAKVEEDFLGDPEAALQTLRRAFEEHPEIPETFDSVQAALYQRARWRELIELYKEAAKHQEPVEAVRLFHEAAKLEEESCKDPDAALTLLRSVFEAYPEVEASSTTLLSSLERLGRFEDLVKVYVAMAERAGLPTRVTHILTAAKLKVEKLSDREGALALLQRCYRDHPQDPRALPALTEALTEMGRWEELISIYEAIEKKAPNEATKNDAIEKMAAICRDHLRDLKRAFLIRRRKIKLDRRDDLTLSELEELAYEAGAYDELCTLYDDLVTHASHASWKTAYLSRQAKVREEWQGNAEAALRSIFLAFQCTPDDKALLEELKRLGEVTADREPLFKAYLIRRSQAKEVSLGERRRYTLLAAEVADEYLLDPNQAFELRLDALRIQPDDAENRKALKRLAQDISELEDDPMPIWQRLGEVYLAIAQTLNAAERIAYLHEIAHIQDGMMRQPEAAMTTLETALTLAPGRVESAELLESCARKSGALPRAAAAFLREAELSDVNEIVYPLLSRAARIREELGDIVGAVDLLRQVLSLVPSDTQTISRIEAVLTKAGRFEELIQHHERIASGLRPGPARRERYFAIALLLEERLGKPREAINVYQRLLQADPNDQDSLAALSRLYEKQGEWRKLIDLLEKRAQTNPKEAASLHRRIADIFAERLRLPKNALAAYEAALAIEPSDRSSWLAVSHLYERQQRWQDAARALQELVRLTPGNEAIPLQLRRADILHTRLRDLGGAKHALEDALSRGPQGDAEREVRTRLTQLGKAD